MSEKNEGSTRGLDVPRDWWPDVAIGLATFAAIGLLPLALGGYVHERGFAQYALLWRELSGEAGRLPLETPKPFTTLRAALGYGPYYGLAALLFSAAPVALGRLSLRLYGTRVIGVGAVVLLLVANGYFLPGPVLDGFWPLPFVGLASLSLWAFAEGRYATALAAMGVAGLIRPDAWGYVLLLLALIVLLDREAWRPAYLAALLCVPAWLLYDFGLSGRWLYSSTTLDAYREMMGIPATTPGIFWSRLLTDVSEAYVLPLLLVGVSGLAVALWRTADASAPEVHRRRAHALSAGLVVLGVLGYWVLSGLGGGFVLHVRFFVLPLFLLHLYALVLPMEAVAWWPERQKGAPLGAAGRRAVATGCLMIAAGYGWHRAAPWPETRETHRILHLQKAARADALGYLRDRWVNTEQRLLTGRSLEVFAYRLGPEAARRMHFFRVIAEERERLPALAPGVAIYLGHDIAGADNWFIFLRRGQRALVRDLGVLFEPRRNLEHDGQVLGLIYTFGRASEEEAAELQRAAPR